MDKVQKTAFADCSAASSEPFRLLQSNVLITRVEHYQLQMLPAVLYGCEISHLTLKRECKLKVFENCSREVCGVGNHEVG
jgi:hypothetical protein